MKHQAVILDFERKSVQYVEFSRALKAIEKSKPANVSAGSSTPPPRRRKNR